MGTIFKLFLSCGLIFFSFKGLDISIVYSRIISANYYYTFFALMLVLGLAFVHSARWKIVLRKLQINLSFRDSMKLVLISYFFNQTLPSTIGGDAYKIWGAYRMGNNFQDVVSSVLVDRILTLISVLVMILFGFPFLLKLLHVSLSWRMAWLFLLVCALILILFVSHRHLGNWIYKWRLVRGLIHVLASLRLVFSDIKVTSYVLALSIYSYFVLSFAVFLLACGMSINLEFKYSLILIPLVILVSVLPVSIAGWGVREGAMIFSLSLVGIPSFEAASLSILFGLVILASGFPGGLIWLSQKSGRNK